MTDAYYLDEPRPGPEGYDPDWDDLIPPFMRGSRFWTGAMYYGFQGQPLTMRQWVAVHRTRDRFIARTPIVGRKTVAEVSTVWLGMNHRFVFDDGRGDPIIFESMVFGGGDLDQDYMQRYSSWHAALAGHAEIVRLVELELVELAEPASRTNRRGNHPLEDVAREFGIDLDEEGDE